MSRARGYILDYCPQQKTVELLDQVQAVLEEYRESLPITLRQVFYRLVGKYHYPKSEQAYERLGNHVSNARRARRIPFAAIRDDGVTGGAPNHYRDADEFVEAVRGAARSAVLDVLADQARYVEILSEAGGMVPQLQAVATRYSVPVFSSGGFDSTTARRAIADRLLGESRPAVVLHLGDLDPSGESIFDALAGDVLAYLAVDNPGLDVEFRRVALTADQVTAYALPTAPPKRSDSRSRGWQETCQLEALPPDTLATLLRVAIEQCLDMERVRRRWAQNESLRAELGRRVA